MAVESLCWAGGMSSGRGRIEVESPVLRGCHPERGESAGLFDPLLLRVADAESKDLMFGAESKSLLLRTKSGSLHSD